MNVDLISLFLVQIVIKTLRICRTLYLEELYADLHGADFFTGFVVSRTTREGVLCDTALSIIKQFKLLFANLWMKW